MRGFLRFVRGNTIALLALFIALGGTTYAATALPKNSVGTKQLKKNAVTTLKIKNGNVTGPKLKNGVVTNAKIAANAVTGAKVKDDSLTGSDVNESTLGTVPSATNAANATNATTVGGLHATDISRGGTSGSDSSTVISGTSVTSLATAQVLNTVSFVAPRTGQVFVSWSAWQSCTAAEVGEVKLFVDGTGDGSFFVVPSCSTGGDFRVNSFSKLLPVTAGTHAFVIGADDFNGGTHSLTLNDSRLNVLFVPFNQTGTASATSLKASASHTGAGPGQ
jgi:hypothetical protein